MEKSNILKLIRIFESYVNKLDNWLEFWFARDLQQLLWYKEWRNFLKVISKAKISLEKTKEDLQDHFVGVNKMVIIGSWWQRNIDDGTHKFNHYVNETLVY